jgi:hypothetical protein
MRPRSRKMPLSATLPERSFNMSIDPGDWTVNAKLAALDPLLARLLEIQHFKPIDPDAVALSDIAKSTVDVYVSAIISLAVAARAMQTAAFTAGNFRQSASGGLGASAGSRM